MEKRHSTDVKIYVKLELISCGNTRNLHSPWALHAPCYLAGVFGWSFGGWFTPPQFFELAS